MNVILLFHPQAVARKEPHSLSSFVLVLLLLPVSFLDKGEKDFDFLNRKEQKSNNPKKKRSELYRQHHEQLAKAAKIRSLDPIGIFGEQGALVFRAP